MTAPGEVLEEVLSDRSSTLLASTTNLITYLHLKIGDFSFYRDFANYFKRFNHYLRMITPCLTL